MRRAIRKTGTTASAGDDRVEELSRAGTAVVDAAASHSGAVRIGSSSAGKWAGSPRISATRARASGRARRRCTRRGSSAESCGRDRPRTGVRCAAPTMPATSVPVGQLAIASQARARALDACEESRRHRHLRVLRRADGDSLSGKRRGAVSRAPRGRSCVWLLPLRRRPWWSCRRGREVVGECRRRCPAGSRPAARRDGQRGAEAGVDQLQRWRCPCRRRCSLSE